MPNYAGTPEAKTGAQMGRVFLEVTGTVEPYGSYRIKKKQGVFHRFNRNHVGEPNRELNNYGFGRCRSKEYNGQFLFSNPILVPSPDPHEFLVHIENLAEDPCNIAAYNRNTADYHFCTSQNDPDDYLIGNLSGETWDTYVRFKLPIPADATIVEASLTVYVAPFGTPSPVPIVLKLLDDANLVEFGTTQANTYGIAYTTDQYDFTNTEIIQAIPGYMDSEDIPDPADRKTLAKLIQAALALSGYTEDDFIGIKIHTQPSFIDTTTLGSDEYMLLDDKMVLSVRYRDADWTPESALAGPPRLMGFERWDTNRVLDTVTGPEMNEDPGGGINSTPAWDNFSINLPGTDYEYIWFAPVPNIDLWYDEDDHGPTPLYGPDAHNSPYIFNECGTYEIACTRHIHPFGYANLGETSALVKPGLRACVGHSDIAPLTGVEPIYALDCPDLAKTFGMQDSIVRRYRAQTAKVRHVYSTLFNWYIEYEIHINAMFVYGDERDFLAMPGPNGPDDYGAVPRWNLWYEGKIVAEWRAPSSVTEAEEYASFVAWVNTKENKFGGYFHPKTTSQCNDVMLRCGGVICAMGDTIRPDTADQDACQDTQEASGHPDFERQLPCKEESKYSYWYLPTLGSNHPYTPSGGPVIEMWPELGLFHEATRVVYTNPEQTTTSSEDSWLQVGLQSNPVVMHGATALDSFPRNQVIDMVPFFPLNTQDLPDPGSYIKLEFDDTEGLVVGDGVPLVWSAFVDTSTTTQGAMQSVCDTLFGTGNTLVVLKSSSPYYVWTVEFIGNLATKDIASKVSSNLGDSFIEPDGYFDYQATVVITPKNGGLTEP